MRRFYVIGFLALMLVDTLTQVSIKLAAQRAAPTAFGVDWLLRVAHEPWIYGALLGYLGAFVIWMTLLKHAPIGPAFAAGHLEIVSVLSVSVLWLGESLSVKQVIGSSLIVLGILVLGLPKRQESTAQAGSP